MNFLSKTLKNYGKIKCEMKYLCEFLINHTICICGDCRCCSRLIYLSATMHNYSLFMSFHMPAKTFRFSITEYAFWTIESMTFKCGLISEGILNSARLIKGQFIFRRYYVVGNIHILRKQVFGFF